MLCIQKYFKYYHRENSKGQESDEQVGLEAGANEYHLKPFDPRAVLNRVRELLG